MVLVSIYCDDEEHMNRTLDHIRHTSTWTNWGSMIWSQASKTYFEVRAVLPEGRLSVDAKREKRLLLEAWTAERSV